MRLRSFLTTAILFSCSTIMAQDDPEYRMEFGAGLGLMTYEGDFNGSILSGENMSPSASIMLRRVMNPRSALRFAFGFGSIKGSSKNLSTYYPDFNTTRYVESARESYEFKNTLVDFNALYEYNFFPSGTGKKTYTIYRSRTWFYIRELQEWHNRPLGCASQSSE